MPAPWPQHKKDAVLADYDAGMGPKAIAEKHGCSDAAVLKWASDREVLRSERRSRLLQEWPVPHGMAYWRHQRSMANV